MPNLKLPRWFILLAFIVSWPAAVLADPTLKAPNGDGLVLHDTPCQHEEVLVHLLRMGAPVVMFKQATLTYEGKDWKSCWIDIEGVVLSWDEEGAPFMKLPRSAFKEPGI